MNIEKQIQNFENSIAMERALQHTAKLFEDNGMKVEYCGFNERYVNDSDLFDDDMQKGMIILKDKVIYICIDSDDQEDVLWHELGHYFASITESQDNEAFAQAFSELVRGVKNQIYNSKHNNYKQK